MNNDQSTNEMVKQIRDSLLGGSYNSGGGSGLTEDDVRRVASEVGVTEADVRRIVSEIESQNNKENYVYGVGGYTSEALTPIYYDTQDSNKIYYDVDGTKTYWQRQEFLDFAASICDSNDWSNDKHNLKPVYYENNGTKQFLYCMRSNNIIMFISGDEEEICFSINLDNKYFRMISASRKAPNPLILFVVTGTASGSNQAVVENDSSNYAMGFHSHAEGKGSIATHAYQHVLGENNIPDPLDIRDPQDPGAYVEIVGNGTDRKRSNARTLDWLGNERLQGGLTLGAGTNDEVTLTAPQLQAIKQFCNIVDSSDGGDLA